MEIMPKGYNKVVKKEFIKKIPVIGSLLQIFCNKLVSHFKVIREQQDDWTIRVEKVSTIYGNYFSWRGDTITEQLIQYSAHTRNELAMIKTLISPGDNIVDIGAHIGTFSIPFSLFNKAQGKVFAFEANPENYNLLRMNIVENDVSSSVIPHLSVVSNTDSKYRMFLPEGGNSGMYTFIPGEDNSTVRRCVTNIDTWHNQNYKDVKIHFIKIDVEGAEVSVLESCQNLIRKYRPILYIEINEFALSFFNRSFEDIERLLELYEYHFFKNIGDRNSNNDLFEMSKLINLKEGGPFFDVLAIHPSNPKYPESLRRSDYREKELRH